MNKDLEAEITRILEENNTTAASIALIEADGSWHTLGIGFSDKTLVKLVEEDKLGLNDPILAWIEDVEFHNPWENESPVRIAHL